MPRSHRNYVPYLDEEFNYSDDTPFFKAGCRGLLMLSSGAVVIIILGLPFWTAYQIGRGGFGRHGCLLKAIILLVSFVELSGAMVIFIVDAVRLFQVIVTRHESEFSTGMTLVLMFSFAYLSSLALSYFFGYLKRTRFTLRQG